MEHPIIPGFCSVFIGVRRTVYLNLRIHQILTMVKSGQFEVAIGNLRSLLETDEEKYNQEKSRLLSFTPACTFTGYRNSKLIRSESRILVIDFDHLSDVIYAKALVCDDPHTLACFISPSGRGIKVFVKRYSHRYDSYASSYQAASIYYRRILREGFDKADDIARLCFLSHDPELYWNPRSYEINYKITRLKYNENRRNFYAINERTEFDEFW